VVPKIMEAGPTQERYQKKIKELPTAVKGDLDQQYGEGRSARIES